MYEILLVTLGHLSYLPNDSMYLVNFIFRGKVLQHLSFPT